MNEVCFYNGCRTPPSYFCNNTEVLYFVCINHIGYHIGEVHSGDICNLKKIELYLKSIYANKFKDDIQAYNERIGQIYLYSKDLIRYIKAKTINNVKKLQSNINQLNEVRKTLILDPNLESREKYKELYKTKISFSPFPENDDNIYSKIKNIFKGAPVLLQDNESLSSSSENEIPNDENAQVLNNIKSSESSDESIPEEDKKEELPKNVNLNGRVISNLQEIDFSNTFILVTGEAGAGKTTMINLIYSIVNRITEFENIIYIAYSQDTLMINPELKPKENPITYYEFTDPNDSDDKLILIDIQSNELSLNGNLNLINEAILPLPRIDKVFYLCQDDHDPSDFNIKSLKNQIKNKNSGYKAIFQLLYTFNSSNTHNNHIASLFDGVIAIENIFFYLKAMNKKAPKNVEKNWTKACKKMIEILSL